MSNPNLEFETNFPPIRSPFTTKTSIGIPTTRSARKRMNIIVPTEVLNDAIALDLPQTRSKSLIRDDNSEITSEFESTNTSPERPVKTIKSRYAKKTPTHGKIQKSFQEEKQPFPNYDDFCASNNRTMTETSNDILLNTLKQIENDNSHLSKGCIDKIMQGVATLQKMVLIAEKEIRSSRENQHKQTSNLHTQTSPHKSYLQAVINQTNQGSRVPTQVPAQKIQPGPSKNIIPTIKPRDDTRTILINHNTIDNLTSEIQKKFNPFDINVPVKRIATTRRGKTVIEVEDAKDLPTISEEILRHFPRADIDRPRKRRPQLNIFDIDKSVKFEEILPQLFKLNRNLNEDLYANVLSLRKTGETNICTLEVDAQLFKQIFSLEKLKIGWTRCKFKENFYTPRCFRCLEFGHTQKNCSLKTKRCGNCGSSHEGVPCNRPTKCINCIQNNKKSPVKLNYEHRSDALTCPCISQRVEFLRSITNYNA